MPQSLTAFCLIQTVWHKLGQIGAVTTHPPRPGKDRVFLGSQPSAIKPMLLSCTAFCKTASMEVWSGSLGLLTLQLSPQLFAFKYARCMKSAVVTVAKMAATKRVSLGARDIPNHIGTAIHTAMQ